MAIIFNSDKYGQAIVDTNTIIGVIGKNYLEFLDVLEGKDIFYLKNGYDYPNIETENKMFSEYLKLLNIDINKKYLSHSERKLLNYYKMIESNSKIMIIDEPYLDLDSNERKIIDRILKKLVKEKKTVIIGSKDINIIYAICKKILVINDNSLLYNNVDCLTDIKFLKKNNLEIPKIVEFIEFAKEKNIKIPYSKDIRDLIKDVYRNVSKR